MRVLRVTAPLLVIAALAFAASSAQADVCQPAGAKLLKSTSKATVYKLRSGDDRIYYGCLRSSGLQTHLATQKGPGSYVELVRLRGHFVAFKDNTGEREWIKAFNLATGRHVKRYPGADGVPEALVVGRSGRLAWMTFYKTRTLYWSSFTTPPHKLVSDGSRYGESCFGPWAPPCIKPGSLHLTGRHHDREIAWFDGKTRYFVIP